MPVAAPSGSNTYVPSFDASLDVVAYTREADKFRINGYTKQVPVKKDQGYALSLDADGPARVVSEDDFLWEDGADAPAGNAESQKFQFNPYRTVRLNFPFAIGKKAADQADWPVLAAYGKMEAMKAMTVRTLKATAVLTTPGNWGANTGDATGAWTTSSETALNIQNTLNAALLMIEQQSNAIMDSEDSLKLVMNPILARAVATSPEYRNYIKGSPDALGYLTDHKNPNRKYGLAKYLYGVEVAVENAVRVTTREGIAPTRQYVWPTAAAALVYRPNGLVADESEQVLNFATLAFRMYENMTVESKSDPDNRRELGRVVEDYQVQLQAPQTGYLITSIV